jgi:hypothetical protein
MPRTVPAPSIQAIIEEAVAGVVVRATSTIREFIEAQVAAELKAAGPRASSGRAVRVTLRRSSRRAARVEMTKWVADRRARRVPNFVIELTGGLDTKKKIVAKVR